VVEPDAVAMLPRLVRHYGEPFGDHSALPCFYLSQLAREHVTVALNGDGGDEGFAGYQRYSSNLLAARLEGLPSGLRRALGAAGTLAGPGADPRALRSRAQRFAGRLAGGRERRYLDQVQVFDAAARATLYTPELAAQVVPSAADEVLLGPWREASGAELLDQLLEIDAGVYLPGDLLPKIDISTMAYALEARSPLLDHELLELAASIPAAHKARGAQRKIALRGALRGWVPDEILDGRKQGFELPVARWLRGELAPFAREVLLDRASTERGWLRPEGVEAMLDEHAGGGADHGRKLWALLTLELWAQSELAAPPQREAVAA